MEAEVTSSVLPVALSGSLITTQEEERVLAVLFQKINKLDQEVYELKTKKIIEDTQLPPEILANSGMFPDVPKRFKRGYGARPILRSEIEEAMAQSEFCSDQARYLGIHLQTYRKHAKRHGLWKPQPNHKGCKKPWGPEKGKYPLSKILAGEFNDNELVTDWMVKKKLLKAGWVEECAVCGYHQRHLVTKRVPLLLDHMDGNQKNFKKENLRLVCWNHMIECGRGYMSKGIRYFDPDWNVNEK